MNVQTFMIFALAHNKKLGYIKVT